MENEMCAGVNATKDIMFVRDILTFMGHPPSGPTPLIIDNDPMWKNIRNAVLSKYNRHWELWMSFVREAYAKLKVSVHLTGTDYEIADILTKALETNNPKYKKFRNTIMNIIS